MNSRSGKLVPAFMMCLLVTCGTQAKAISGFWKNLSPMPSLRQEVGVAELEGKVYVVGGLVNGAGSAQVDVYDVAQDMWQPGPPLPFPLHHVAAVSLGGNVYSIGGFSGSSFTPVATVLALDPATGIWSARSSLPTARGALAAAVIDGKIYAVGGSAIAGNSGELAEYDPVGETWSILAPMPTARNHHAAATLGGKLYVVGGRSPNLSTLEVFDPVAGSWETRSSMPTARSGLAAAVVSEFLFVLGGEIPGVFAENEVYDPRTDTWFTLEPMPVPRHGIGAAVIENRIIIPGGATEQGVGATNITDQFLVLSEVTAFAQFGDSQDISSQIVITNPQSEAVNALLEIHGDDGAGLVVTLDGATSSKFSQVLGARTTKSLSTAGSGAMLLAGAALLFSDRPLLANILFSSSFGFTNVPGQTPGKNFLVSLHQDKASGLDSGVAIANISHLPNTVTLLLRDESGVVLASTQIHLAPFGHFARLLIQLFEGVALDSFQGSLEGSAEQDIASMAILLRPNQMATLPVLTSTTPFQ